VLEVLDGSVHAHAGEKKKTSYVLNHFVQKPNHFAKTGSGRTKQGKQLKTRAVFASRSSTLGPAVGILRWKNQ
jgi:hypothetical protein